MAPTGESSLEIGEKNEAGRAFLARILTPDVPCHGERGFRKDAGRIRTVNVSYMDDTSLSCRVARNETGRSAAFFFRPSRSETLGRGDEVSGFAPFFDGAILNQRQFYDESPENLSHYPREQSRGHRQ
jgi:hypothetical protein